MEDKNVNYVRMLRTKTGSGLTAKLPCWMSPRQARRWAEKEFPDWLFECSLHLQPSGE
jgi:hypothetical protein